MTNVLKSIVRSVYEEKMQDFLQKELSSPNLKIAKLRNLLLDGCKELIEIANNESKWLEVLEYVDTTPYCLIVANEPPRFILYDDLRDCFVGTHNYTHAEDIDNTIKNFNCNFYIQNNLKGLVGLIDDDTLEEYEIDIEKLYSEDMTDFEECLPFDLRDYCENLIKKGNLTLEDIQALASDGLGFTYVGEYLDFAKNLIDDNNFIDNFVETKHFALNNPNYIEDKEYPISKEELDKLNAMDLEQTLQYAQNGFERYLVNFNSKNMLFPLNAEMTKGEILALEILKINSEVTFRQEIESIAEELKEQQETKRKPNKQ